MTANSQLISYVLNFSKLLLFLYFTILFLFLMECQKNEIKINATSEEKSRREYAHCSRGFGPENMSYNMKDLDPIELNSADDVRQSIKNLTTNTPVSGPSNKSRLRPLKIQSSSEKEVQSERRPETSYSSKPKKKKRGRPPLASISKKAKKDQVASMYIGKLSNVVKFKRSFDCDSSDSDVDGCYCRRMK